MGTCFSDAFRQLVGRILGTVTQNHAKLVTTKTSQLVLGAHLLGESPSDFAQDLVSSRVPKAIIDQLKTI